VDRLDHTGNCPIGGACETCGDDLDLHLATVTTPIGVYCVTMCQDCIGDAELPPMSWGRAVRRALKHCEHLGVTADRMADLMAAEADALV
jgi:hypothetical protein